MAEISGILDVTSFTLPKSEKSNFGIPPDIEGLERHLKANILPVRQTAKWQLTLYKTFLATHI